jgi:hypothetical protein
VLAASAAVGVNVIVRLSADSDSAPGTLTPVLLVTRYTFAGVIVSGLMGALNKAVGVTAFDTPVALAAGVMVAVGGDRAV